MRYYDKIVQGQIITQQNLLKEKALHPSDDGVNFGDRPHQHPQHFIFTAHINGA